MISYKKVKKATKRNLFISWFNFILLLGFVSIILILFSNSIIPALKDFENAKIGLDSISSLDFSNIDKLTEEVKKFYNSESLPEDKLNEIIDELKVILENFKNNTNSNPVDLINDTVQKAIEIIKNPGYDILTQEGKTFISNIESANNSILNINKISYEWFGIDLDTIFKDIKENNFDLMKYIKILINSKAGILLIISVSCFILTFFIGIYLFIASLTYISKNNKLDYGLKQSTWFLVLNALFSLIGILDWLFWTIIFIKWKVKNKQLAKKTYNGEINIQQ